MNYTCKNCGTRVKIPEEWTILRINRKIKCKICNKKYNLLLQKENNKVNLPKISEKSGTVITDYPIQEQIVFKLKIEHELTGKIVGYKELHLDKTYIIGRDLTSIKTHNKNFEPIVIGSHLDPAISRIHFELKIDTKRAPKIIIQDLNSLNGTYIFIENQVEKLKANDKVILGSKDKVKVGKHTIITIL